MYKVCIADDETMIQKSIASRLQATAASLQLKGCAGNGEEALGLYWLMKPDIYFVDINMPGMTGLQFIRKVRQDDPRSTTKFIIISGYSDFPHVQEAIKTGVMDYIKKPISGVEFAEVVQQAMQTIEAERRRQSEMQQRHPTLLCDTYFGEHPLGEKLRDGTLLALCCREALSQSEESSFFNCLNMPPPLSLSVRDVPTLRLYHLPGTPVEKKALQQAVANLPPAKQPFLLWAHPHGEEWTHLANLLEQSMNLRFLAGMASLAGCAPGVVQQSPNIDMLGYALDKGQAATAEKAIRNTLEAALASAETALGISLLHRQIVLLIINKYVQRYLQIPESYKNEIAPFATCKYPDAETLIQKLCAMGTALATTVEKASQSSELIESVCGWLNRHYMDNVSLNTLANRFFVSAPYLSRRFKEKRGQALFQYLEDLRLEKAQEYLMQSEAQIVDISSRVGYIDPNYFAKVFKKKVGLSPSDYRGKNR